MSWNEGYHTDINYTHGYYTEMNPAAMRFLMLAAGFTPPEVSRACELGYGQGLSINIHAAAENIAWTGTDFNPSQAAFAQELAKISGARAVCYSDSFHDFCNRTDLPEFDYIALHGIWSWISHENQDAIVKLIAKKLRVGGALYISYNTYPGWAAFVPARDLMKLYMDRHHGPGMDVQSKVADTFSFLERLSALKPAYFAANPEAQKRLELFKDKDSAYLVHEFLNDAWEPVNFWNMAQTLEEARMTFACSANPLMAIPGLGLTSEQAQLIAAITDPVLRETALDFIFNTQFRKDYWLKGPRPMQAAARISALRNELFILMIDPDKLTREIKTALGNLTLSVASHYILLAVFRDGKAHSIGELEKTAQEMASAADATEGLNKENVNSFTQALCVLMAAGLAAPVQRKQDALKAKPYCDKLNAFIENQAVASGQLSFLASPVTGGGIALARFDLLLLLACRHGAKTPEAMATYVRAYLNSVEHKIVKEGKTIDSQDETLAYLQELAVSFSGVRLPTLKNLLIA